MKQQIKFLIIAFVVAIAGSPAVAQNSPATSAASRPPEVVLREFYKWYVDTLNHSVDPLKSRKVTMKKYVTLRFMQEMERNEKLPEGKGFDADYFLQTQEDEGLSSKNISVTKVAVRGETAMATVTFDGGYPNVRVSLRKEDGVWKIDNVKNLGAPAK